jgi:hypothetical protein
MEQTLHINNVNNMSIYIPHVFANILPDVISKTFEDLKYGKVKHIDFVDKMDKNGKMYHSVYVHFEYWYDNVACKNIQERVKNPDKEARIVYKEPWYWICLENTSTTNGNVGNSKKISGSKTGERKIKINLDDLFAAATSSCKKKDDISCTKKEIDIEYVKQLEMINYKLSYDLRNIQGDFIMV